MLYLYTQDQAERYQQLLREALPEIDIACWPQEVDAKAVTHAAVWSPPEGFFARFPRLQAVFALGAGVDKLLRHKELSPQVSLIRLTDTGMAQQMREYCLYGLLHYQRGMDIYRQQQSAGRWVQLPTRQAAEVRVSILGMGELGSRVAQDLVDRGYRVTGWRRQSHAHETIPCVHGLAALPALLRNTDVLFCVLPDTPETRHLLNAERLALLPSDAALINAGRGSLIDEAALLAHLDRGHLRFAMLDVFATEPLAPDHPFWHHPRLILTPHVAADTILEEAVRQIAARLRALSSGQPVNGLVDRQRGY